MYRLSGVKIAAICFCVILFKCNYSNAAVPPVIQFKNMTSVVILDKGIDKYRLYITIPKEVPYNQAFDVKVRAVSISKIPSILEIMGNSPSMGILVDKINETHKLRTKEDMSNVLEASITGNEFTITPKTPNKLNITSVDTTGANAWIWEIKPNSSGKYNLQLTVSGYNNTNFGATPKVLYTQSKNIIVTCKATERIMIFIKNNWQWLWAAIVVPLIGWGWNLRRKKT